MRTESVSQTQKKENYFFNLKGKVNLKILPRFNITYLEFCSYILTNKHVQTNSKNYLAHKLIPYKYTLIEMA